MESERVNELSFGPDETIFTKINTKGLLAPCLVRIIYLTSQGHLNVFISHWFEQPNSEVCDIKYTGGLPTHIQIVNPHKGCLYYKENMYVALSATTAMHISITVEFPVCVINPNKTKRVRLKELNTLQEQVKSKQMEDLVHVSDRMASKWKHNSPLPKVYEGSHMSSCPLIRK